LKVVTEEAVRMSDGRSFHAVGLATQNARLPRRRLVQGTTLHELQSGGRHMWLKALRVGLFRVLE